MIEEYGNYKVHFRWNKDNKFWGLWSVTNTIKEAIADIIDFKQEIADPDQFMFKIRRK